MLKKSDPQALKVRARRHPRVSPLFVGRGALMCLVALTILVTWSQPAGASSAGLLPAGGETSGIPPGPAPSPAEQIRDTGALIVRALGPDGMALPGVQVVVKGDLGNRTEYTSVNGSTRFAGLTPGIFSATFTLEGFKEVIHENVRVSVGRTTEVVVMLEFAAVVETVTVSGESPVVDMRSTNVGSVYSNELILYAPTASGLWAGVLDHIPGVVNEAIDVGGSEAGQQSRFSSRGGSPSQNVYSLNSANTTDPEALGASSMYYSIDSLEEIGVSTAAHDVEIQSPGVVLNMVSKTGSNDWHGGAKIFYENEAFVSSNVTDEQRARGAGEGNPNNLLADFSAQLGGPIIRDRAWFFIDFWNFDVERFIVGLPASDLDDTRITNWTTNVTVQLTHNQKLTARFFTDGKVRDNRGAGMGVPPETSWLQDSFTFIPQMQYQGVFGPNAFVDLRGSFVRMDFPLQAKDADSPSPHPNFRGDEMPPSWEASTGTFLPGSPPSREVLFERDHTEVSGNLSYYWTEATRSHDIKVGGSLSRTSSFTPESRGYIWGFQQQFLNQDPWRVRFWNHSGVDVFNVQRPNAPWVRGTALGVYAQDSITFNNRFTVNVGFRIDYSTSYMPAQCRPDSLFPQLGEKYQAACYEEQRDATSWKNFAPRLGFIYDLTADGKTAVKANLSRYSNQQGVRWAAYLNPNDVGNDLYTWEDRNGDGMFQFGEQHTLLRTFFPGVNTKIDARVSSPTTDEISVGIDRELLPGFLLSGTLIFRNDSNFVEDVNLGVPYGPIAEYLEVPDSYTPVTVTEPGPDGIVGTDDDGGPITIFDQDPSTFAQDVYFLTNPVRAMGFDFLYNRYVGLSLVGHKRWNNNWQLLASWDIGRARGTFDFGGAGGAGSILDDPNTDINRDGLTVWDRTHLVRVTGNYLIGDPFWVNLGMFLRLQSGEPMIRRAILPARVGGYDGPLETTINQDWEQVRVEARGEHQNPTSIQRLDTVAVLDLRAEKQFTVGRAGVLHLYFDLFNITNTNTETAIEVDSSAQYNNIFWLVSPRVFRFGIGYDF